MSKKKQEVYVLVSYDRIGIIRVNKVFATRVAAIIEADKNNKRDGGFRTWHVLAIPLDTSNKAVIQFHDG